jgi:alpha-D-xyloside xylohydrolase
MDAPKDIRLHSVDDQYMMGDRMMVAPLFSGEASRKVVLPAGGWHDFWTGEALPGGTEIQLPASTEKIPVYVKSGSIMPWADVGLYAGAVETLRLTVKVFGDGSLPFTWKNEKEEMQLTWSHGQGHQDGKSKYDVYAWKHVG